MLVYFGICIVERHVFESEKLKRTKPYNGELGPQSYKSWQMMDYFMVIIINSFVSKL